MGKRKRKEVLKLRSWEDEKRGGKFHTNNELRIRLFRYLGV